MKYTILFIFLAAFTFSAQAQSETTEKLHKKYSESLAFFFYNNTLRMINQKDDKDFDALIKDIEKMKFLMIKKEGFAKADYQKLVSSYKAESFEEMMSSRHDGKNFDVYMKDGKAKGMIVTVNDDENHLQAVRLTVCMLLLLLRPPQTLRLVHTMQEYVAPTKADG